MKCLKIYEPKSVNGKKSFKIIRVSDNEAHEMITKKNPYDLIQYTSKSSYREFKNNLLNQ
jgi:hypothetical protein